MIVIIDTNVWISALIFGTPESVPARAVKRAVNDDTLVISTELLTEFRRILGDKFRWPAARITTQLERFFSGALVVTLQHNVHICRDPKDDMFLECAALANAAMLITGDKDLLSLASYGDTRIVTPLVYVQTPL